MPQPTPTNAGKKPAQEPTAEPTSPAVEPNVPLEAEPLVRQAKKDLAESRRVAVDDVRLVEVEAVDWPDASLGCPEPEKMYAQVITPGYRIVLEVKGETVNYHTDSADRVIRCESN